jgi:uncharacterized protein (DUF433 family)
MQLPDFLSQDKFGGIRLAGHRIDLFHVLWHYNEGYSAEMLREQFPSLSMALIYKVLAFYWENKAEVDAYLVECRQQLAQLEAILPGVDLAALRARLAAQQALEASSTPMS